MRAPARVIAATIRSSVTGSPASGERMGIITAFASLRHPTGAGPWVRGNTGLTLHLLLHDPLYRVGDRLGAIGGVFQ
jgi:hypothetical protein